MYASHSGVSEKLFWAVATHCYQAGTDGAAAMGWPSGPKEQLREVQLTQAAWSSEASVLLTSLFTQTKEIRQASYPGSRFPAGCRPMCMGDREFGSSGATHIEAIRSQGDGAFRRHQRGCEEHTEHSGERVSADTWSKSNVFLVTWF